MPFDAFSYTYHDPTPPCPFCGALPRVPAIMPAEWTECSGRGCWFRVPIGEWHRVAAALAGDTTATRLVRAAAVRDDALRALRMAQEDMQRLAGTLEQQIATLERAREVPS